MSRRLTPAPVVAIAAAVMTVIFASAKPACATLIVVPNASFQNPDVADNAFTDTNSNANAIPNWTFAVTERPAIAIVSGGVWDPGVTDYTVAGGNNTALPGDAQGGQAAYIYLDQNGGIPTGTLSGEINSAALTTVASDTKYTLTVALGRGIGILVGDVEISLVAAGFPLGSIEISPAQIPQNTFTKFILELTTFEEYPFEGLELSARISHTYAGPGSASLDIDNIRFQSDPVPEPGSAAMTLLAIGAVVPTVRRRR
jgi:HpiC1 cyclase/PEP-CTERM motif